MKQSKVIQKTAKIFHKQMRESSLKNLSGKSYVIQIIGQCTLNFLVSYLNFPFSFQFQNFNIFQMFSNQHFIRKLFINKNALIVQKSYLNTSKNLFIFNSKVIKQFNLIFTNF